MTEVVRIQLNGSEREIAEGTSIAGLLEALQIDSRHVAVERNRVIVRRAEFASQRLEEGDRIEIVHFVGGG